MKVKLGMHVLDRRRLEVDLLLRNIYHKLIIYLFHFVMAPVSFPCLHLHRPSFPTNDTCFELTLSRPC